MWHAVFFSGLIVLATSPIGLCAILIRRQVLKSQSKPFDPVPLFDSSAGSQFKLYFSYDNRQTRDAPTRWCVNWLRFAFIYGVLAMVGSVTVSVFGSN